MVALVVGVAACATAAAAPAAANPWLAHRVLNMAHQGGEAENPSATMYAYRQSLADGADMLELDVHPTRDGRLVTLHDSRVDRTTNGTGSVYDMTLEQVQRLDAAHWFVPGRNTVRGLEPSAYALRGVRTGAKRPPLGYTAEDFRVPTLDEVLRAFPDVPLNIEIKGRSDTDLGSFLRNADLLADLLNRSGRTDIIVVSFQQQAVDRFHSRAPQVPVAPGITGTAAFFLAGLSPGAGVVAIQPPRRFQGVDVATPDFVARSHRAGYAVHVWFSGQEESERVYGEMLAAGVDGLMPAKPSALERFLCDRGASRPAGNPNHCGAGPRAAAASCRLRVASVGRMARDGEVVLRLRRRGPLDFACGGRAYLRAANGSSRVATGRFAFPYGVAQTVIQLRLDRAAGRRARRGLAIRAATRVDGQRQGAPRRFTVRTSARSPRA